MDTASIINQCLLSLGEDADSLASPYSMTRADILAYINQIYQGPIAERLTLIKTHIYDGADASRTITEGVGTLPTDFLAPVRVYDGDAPDDDPLERILDIEDKVANTSATTQYMLPNMTQIWVFGITPTNDIKMYYHFVPTALTDSSESTPTYLKAAYHVKPFVKAIQGIYATRNSDYGDEIDLEVFLKDILDEIEAAHYFKTMDDTPRTKRMEW